MKTVKTFVHVRIVVPATERRCVVAAVDSVMIGTKTIANTRAKGSTRANREKMKQGGPLYWHERKYDCNEKSENEPLNAWPKTKKEKPFV
jgi:hypothetical protein